MPLKASLSHLYFWFVSFLEVWDSICKWSLTQKFLEEFKKPCNNAGGVGTLLLCCVLWFPLAPGTLQCTASMWLLCVLHLMWSHRAARGKNRKQTHETKFSLSGGFSLLSSVSSDICLFWICGLTDFLPFFVSLQGDVCLTGSDVIWQQGGERTSQYLHL